jgi:hypothetical protein
MLLNSYPKWLEPARCLLSNVNTDAGRTTNRSSYYPGEQQPREFSKFKMLTRDLNGKSKLVWCWMQGDLTIYCLPALWRLQVDCMMHPRLRQLPRSPQRLQFYCTIQISPELLMRRIVSSQLITSWILTSQSQLVFCFLQNLESAP